MKAVIRAFIAIDLSEDIIRKLGEISTGLHDRMGELPVRWIPAENVHLTLKFLGDVSATNVERLAEIIRRVALAHECFEISVGSLGVFPNAKRPRVIWLGVEAPQALFSIQRGIDQETSRLGYETKEQEFSPHLTIARVSRSAGYRELKSIGDQLESETVGFLGAARVEKINLYRSDLKPTGAEYSVVYSGPLHDPNP
ncbi:MAG TPA: RNA 2',3'-cyclic phosphodiesterase [Anaerolineales bacterium]|nr:RNA 2',3'-cyclic phosphodiesterase [Anaerolineales bacterium]